MFDVASLGAAGEGQTIDTDAIGAAIEAATYSATRRDRGGPGRHVLLPGRRIRGVLDGYRAVVAVHSAGDVRDGEQQSALQAFIEAGGFVGVGEAAGFEPGVGLRPGGRPGSTVGWAAALPLHTHRDSTTLQGRSVA